MNTRPPQAASRSRRAGFSGGGGFGLSPATLGIGALAGGLSNFFGGRQAARESENEYGQQIALDRALNPNRPIQEALTRNVRGNFLENLGIMDPNEFGRGGSARAFFQSVHGGVNPALQEEFGNIAGVPGLRLGGQLVGEDPNEFFKAKKPGFFESLASGAAGLIGG